jgi:tetratricopeptide (TPR) repeat protein
MVRSEMASGNAGVSCAPSANPFTDSWRSFRMRHFTRLFASLLILPGSLAWAEEADKATLARKAQDVLRTHCYRCHGQNGVAEGGLNYVTDLGKMVTRDKVVPGDARRSRIYKRLVSTDNPMPPDDEKARPSTADVALIKQWIEAGAPPGKAAEARQVFVSPSEMVARVKRDLETVAERDRPFTRYFTLTHLHNAGLSSDELQSYRHGLSKLVNSLSWGGRVVVPRAIDAEKTIFRIDLRDYQWNEKVWDAVIERNPCGVLPAGESSDYCVEATQCRMPWVRGDWFVAAASRPPLYHEVLQLPARERDLEAMLRIDTAEAIRQERVARAGFNGSGVSRNNRLIERHESGRVVYWKSYDFAGNTGRQNLFAQPLGPASPLSPRGREVGGEGSEGFRHDGGEIIFNLPNGLQAYMLADAQGRRIDKGPTAIVSDPKRPDRAVENGLSCMSCHARGMIDKADQVREHVEKNATAFSKEDVEKVRALYPPRAKMAELLRADARRFQDAVAKTGAPLSATEPVAELAQRFEAELDLPLAAAEAGITPQAFRKALARAAADPDDPRSAGFAKALGTLLVAGGTVQRTVFVDAFPDLVRDLRLGTYLDPAASRLNKFLATGQVSLELGKHDEALTAFARALVIDPQNATAHLGRGDAHRAARDFDRAIDAYAQALKLEPHSAVGFNNCGLARSGRGDHDAAIEDFTQALRFDPKLGAAHLNRGAAHHRRGDHARAIDDYTAAIRLLPTSAVALNNRGLALLDQGELAKAIADFDRALEKDPRLASAFNNRGLAQSRSGELEKAIADFNEAIRLQPRFARAFFNRGIAHEKKGDNARAEADRREAARLDPALATD